MADMVTVDLDRTYVYCVTCGAELRKVVMNLASGELQLGVNAGGHEHTRNLGGA